MSTPYVEYAYADGSANTLRPTKITYPNGREVDYDYGAAASPDDLFSRVFQIQEDTDVLAEYDYLGAASIFRCDYAEPQVRWDLSPTGDTFTGLDSLDRVVDNLWRNYGTSTDADRIKYTYDRASNRTSRENMVAASGNDELYGYDGVNRLRNLGRGNLTVAKDRVTAPTFAERWNLDATGNWSGYGRSDYLESDDSVEQTRTASPVNEITGIANSLGSAWAQPAYDPTGNMTAVPQPPDPTDSFAATYDAWNRLVLLEDDATAVAAYAYDPLNRRVTVDDGANVRHAYFTEQWQALEERLNSSTDAERQFVWGLRYIDDLILRDRTTSGPLDERLYALQDANWNVDAIVDEAGAVQERYRYAAYGTPTFLQPDFTSRSPNQSDFDWETLYCGYRFDTETGLYCVRFRFLQAKLGTWNRRDQLGYQDSPNLYEYVQSSPTIGIDPLGTSVPMGKGVVGVGGSRHVNSRCWKIAEEYLVRLIFLNNAGQHQFGLPRQVGLHTILDVLGVDVDCCKLPIRGLYRPDAAVFNGTQGQIWEIKPLSPYGVRTGYGQLNEYLTMLNSCSGVSAQSGSCAGLAVKDIYAFEGCGLLFHYCVRGVVYYDWVEPDLSPQSVVAPAPAPAPDIDFEKLMSLIGFAAAVAWFLATRGKGPVPAWR